MPKTSKSKVLLLDARPELENLIDWDLTKDIDIKTISSKSGKSICLKCINNAKHKPFDIKIYSIPKTPPYGCPTCREEKRNKNKLINLVPEALEMFDKENNPGINIEELQASATLSVNWKCEKGHTFKKLVCSFQRNSECPYCRIKPVSSVAKLMKQWDFQKNKANGLDPNLLSVASSKQANWKCKKCGYEWSAQIASRYMSKGECPCCETKIIVVAGINDLFSILPEAKDEFDFDNNPGIDSNNLKITDVKTSIVWHCSKCGHRWTALIGSRIIKLPDNTYKLRGCPFCSGYVRTKSYGEEYPELNKIFSVELNKTSLTEIFESNNLSKKFWWHCDICGEDFQSNLGTMINGRNSRCKGCVYCAGKQVLYEKSFGYLHPEVLKEYASSNTIDPFSVTEHSSRTADWVCTNNPDHTWKATFISRMNGQGGCPICKEYNYKTMFCDVYPEAEEFYDTEINQQPIALH